MATKRVVRIDSLTESAWRYSGYDAVVCVDVLLSTTTAVTAVAEGRRVLPAASPREAWLLKRHLGDAVVMTDGLGQTPEAVVLGGPSSLTALRQAGHALVHVSPLGEMLAAVTPRATVYVACLRNLEATAREIDARHARAAILAAGDEGRVCAEDQMAAAWLAHRLEGRGFALEDRNTVNEVTRWGDLDVALVALSRSAERLRSQGRGADVDFVLRHVDDLDVVCGFEDGELRAGMRSRRPATAIAASSPHLPPRPAWGGSITADRV